MKLSLLMIFVLLSPAALLPAEKSPPTYQIPLPPKPDFSSLEWMVGDWTGATLKESRPANIQLSVSMDLGQRIMVFKEVISFAATKNAPAAKESSIGILSASPGDGSYQLDSYSSTGFITRYRVTISGTEVDFNPAGGDQPPPGWLSRLAITHTDETAFTETVQLAPPKRSFFDYYTAKFTKDLTKGPPPASKETSKESKPSTP